MSGDSPLRDADALSQPRRDAPPADGDGTMEPGIEGDRVAGGWVRETLADGRIRETHPDGRIRESVRAEWMPSPRIVTVRLLAVAALAIIAAHLIDGWAYRALAWPDVYGGDLGRMLRVMGFVPFWAAAALALVLHDRPVLRRGTLLLAAPIAGGIVAELLKLLLRRERPWAHDGEWVFRAFTERPFSTGGLALPSSHAMVAFAAAAMLARLFPRAAPVWYTLAAGCGLTRVMAGAHFVSDIVVAAIGGWIIAAWIWRAAASRVIGFEPRPRSSCGSRS